MRFGGRDDRSSSRWRTPRRTYRATLFSLVVCMCLFRIIKNDNRRLAQNRFQEAVDACRGFSQPLSVSDDTPFSTQISEMLLTIDHVFVLSMDTCETKLLKSFAGRASCVVGTKIDACAPHEFIRGPYTHAMKVSFTHAAVLYLAKRANYRHVAVIEDDVAVRRGVFSEPDAPCGEIGTGR